MIGAVRHLFYDVDKEGTMTVREMQLANFMKLQESLTLLSINERSFQIFGDEKFLNSSEGRSILHKNHMSLQLLNVYKTPEPFIYCVNPHTNTKNALIIENKDTWYTMKKVLCDGGSICGIPVKVLIYGEGRKIQSSFSYMEEDTADIHDVRKFYYLGDVDASGIDIYYKLKVVHKAYQILPFEPGYGFLYENRHLKRKKEMKKKTRMPCYEMIPFGFLGDAARVELLDLCNQDYIIPQEILNLDVLRRWTTVSDSDGSDPFSQ